MISSDTDTLAQRAAISPVKDILARRSSDTAYEWAVQRERYMSLETMAPLSDKPIVVLSVLPYPFGEDPLNWQGHCCVGPAFGYAA